MSSSLRSFLIGIAVLPALAITATASTSIAAYQWHTFFGGDANDGANVPATAVDAYGNLYVTGPTNYPWDSNGNPGTTPSAYVAYLTKISPTGQLLWSRFYPGASGDLTPVAITLDSSGNIYITGAGSIDTPSSCSSFLLEVDPYGNRIWGANFGGPGYLVSTVFGITYDAVHDFVYVTGMFNYFYTGYFGWSPWWGGQPINAKPPYGDAMFIMQAQGGANGALGWVGFYFSNPPASGATYGRSIAYESSSDSLYVAGNDGGHVAVWKVAPTSGQQVGQQAWETVYGYGYSYALASYGGNLYATGYSPTGWNGPGGESPLNAFSLGGYTAGSTAFVLKVDTSGKYLWHTFYHGNGSANGEGIAVDGPSTVYVAGSGALAGYNDAAPLHNGSGHFLLQLDNSGAYQWHSLYSAGWDEASSIAVDPAHNVFVSGWTGWSTWNGDNNTPPLHPASGAPSEIFVMRFVPGTPAATTTIASSVAPIAYRPNSQNINLSAAVTSTSTVASGAVSFTLLGATVYANVLNGAAGTPFTVPAGTAVGNYTIQATYYPGTGLTTSSDNSKQLVIGQATPLITWSNPADILFGTALGSTQLNATANNLPGIFTYNPPPGWVLPVGNGQALSVTFSPADETDYLPAAKTVCINVNPSSQPASPAQIVVTKTLTRNPTNNQVVLSLNITNSGGTDAQNVQLTTGKINTTSGTPLPQSLGTVAKGTTVTAALTFAASVGTQNTVAALTVGGTYNAGSFSSASRVTLP